MPPCTKFTRCKAARPSDSQVMQNDFLLVIYFWACPDPTRPGRWLILWQKLGCSSPGNVWPRTNLNHPWILFVCHVTEVGRNDTILTSSYVMSPRSVTMLPSLHTLRMSCHRGRSQCYHPWILFVCNVTEVGRNAAIIEYSSYVMSPRSVAMLPSLHTLRMSCHQGRSQWYHPYIVCHVTEVGHNATILPSEPRLTMPG